MNIEYLKLSEIKPYEQNPRLNDAAVDAVAKSIAEFGFVQPICVDKDMVIVIGHTRFRAGNKLGLKTVPVIKLDLPDDKIRQLRLIDNSTHDLSAWDIEKLLVEMEAMPEVDFINFGLDIDAIMADSQGIVADPDEESPEDGRKQNDRITVIVDDMTQKAEIKQAVESAISGFSAHIK